MRKEKIASFILVALALTMGQSAARLKQETVAEGKGNAEANSLSLTLSTDKQTYKPQEPIYFTLTLRNVSSEWLLVGKYIQFSDIPGAFVMTVTDERGKRLHGDMGYFAGVLGDFKHEDLSDWIRRTRLVLCPGCFLGMTARLRDYKYDLTTPGKYRLQVSYSDIGYKEMQEEGASRKKIEEAKQLVKFPLWSGAIQSPEIFIEVVR